MSQPKPLLRKLGSASTSSTTSASSTSSKPFRAAYTLDGQGYDLSSSYSAPKRSERVKAATPFSRAAYTLDGQGYDLSSKYPYAAPSDASPPSYDWSMAQQSFRSLYTLDWKPCSFFTKA
jgi:hypothetical protein